MCISLLN